MLNGHPWVWVCGWLANSRLRFQALQLQQPVLMLLDSQHQPWLGVLLDQLLNFEGVNVIICMPTYAFIWHVQRSHALWQIRVAGPSLRCRVQMKMTGLQDVEVEEGVATETAGVVATGTAGAVEAVEALQPSSGKAGGMGKGLAAFSRMLSVFTRCSRLTVSA